jgi:hypothetical protein
MKPAMENVLKHGIQDVFMTMWADDGGECSFYALLPSLYAIRQYADGNFDEEKIKQGFYETFGVAFDDFMLLDMPNSCTKEGVEENKEYYNACPTKAFLYNDYFLGQMDVNAQVEVVADYERKAKELRAAAKRVGKKYAYLFTELAALCDVMVNKVHLGIKTREAYQAGDKKALKKLVCEYSKAAKAIKVFYKEFKELWAKENKAFGWEIQDARLGGLACRTEYCKDKLASYLAGKIDKIEELEVELLPYPSKQKYIGLNYYRETVSVSEI